MMTNSTNGQGVSVSMLAQLTELGESLHGSELSTYMGNYPQGVWREPIVHNHEIITEIEESHYSDVAGLRSLRKELAARDAAWRSQPFLSSDNIAVTQGGTHAIQILLQTFGEPASDVLIPAPSYSGYRDICQALKLSYRPYGMDDSENWLTDELLQSLRPDSIMIVNTPHNPSGGQINTAQLRSLEKAARKCGAVVIFDCVYDELIYEGKPPEWNTVFKTVDDYSSFIWLNSFSKNYGLPGVRLGWITASAAMIRKLEPMIEASIISLPDFMQRWASLAVPRMLGVLAQEMKARREYLCTRLSGVAGLEFKRPPAGITMMVKSGNRPAMQLVQQILRSHAALFLPGDGYYGGDPQTLRLCFGYSRTEIDRYVSILSSVLGQSTPGAPPALHSQAGGRIAEA